MSLEIPGVDQPERILKFLSLFDEAQKSTIPIADPKIWESKVTAKNWSGNLQIRYWFCRGKLLYIPDSVYAFFYNAFKSQVVKSDRYLFEWDKILPYFLDSCF